jgi:hypothetical protein
MREGEKMKIFALKPFKLFKQAIAVIPLLLPALAPAAVAFFDPTRAPGTPGGPPLVLTDLQIYTSMNTKAVDTAMKYFEVNSALWSDAAHKARWIILPPGKKVAYVDTTDRFDYPDSTIFVKLFSHDTTPGDTNSRIYWETRLLVKKAGEGTNWYGFSYKWNKGATQATLVDIDAGLDTVVFLSTAPGYRKWHYPSQVECNACHRVGDEGRAVLGFWPAQLKRATKGGTSNQIADLFTAGVFTGAQPNATALSRRFRGMGEAIPTGLTDLERFKVIDTMARAYIAANCSGCHGDRGLRTGATGHAPELNYDYYNFTPRMEYGFRGTSGFGLDLSDQDLGVGDTLYRPAGRYQFLLTLKEWGISTAPGANFDLARPRTTSYPAGKDANPYLVVPGYPSYSTILFRQVARKSYAADSGDLFRALGPAEAGDAQQWKKWIFKAKWGSKAWRDSLAKYNVKFSDAVNYERYLNDGSQMPPLATYIPDTAALKILSEWVRTYRTLVPVPPEDPAVAVRAARLAMQGTPSIQNRVLVVPAGWTGKATMTGLNGRTVPLVTVGRGRYALPASMPAGVYFFKVGDRTFRTSVMR